MRLDVARQDVKVLWGEDTGAGYDAIALATVGPFGFDGCALYLHAVRAEVFRVVDYGIQREVVTVGCVEWVISSFCCLCSEYHFNSSAEVFGVKGCLTNHLSSRFRVVRGRLRLSRLSEVALLLQSLRRLLAVRGLQVVRKAPGEGCRPSY